MNKLSEAQVKKLNGAIDKVMDIMESANADPNKAIIKVAQDMNLTPDYIPVIVAAYNNGSQYAQREKGTTIAEKTAKFKLANTNIIEEQLYNTSKKASANYVASDDFFDYPVGVLVTENKPNYALYSPVVKQANYKQDNSKSAQTEQRITDGVNTVVESIRMEKSAALDAYDDAIKDFAYYLRRVDAPSVPVAIKLAGMVFGAQGPMAIKEAAMRFNIPLKEKQSEPIIAIDSPFYSTCAKCLEKLAEYNNICDEELALLSKCASTLKPIVTRRINEIHKQSSTNNSSPAYFFKKKSSITKQAAPARIFTPPLAKPDNEAHGSKLINSDVSGLEALLKPQWRDLNPYEHNIMRALDDPEQEAKLRDIAVSTNITDLINTDEYLSDQDPEAVIDAYNELMEIAPEIHNKKPLLRAALRQYMESGGIDVQSLGLIGDIGRKTESRRDDERKLLAENVNKMLDNEDRKKQEIVKHEWDLARDEAARELTVSEGRKERMFRAEESRKDRSNQRQIAEARSAYEKFKAKLDASVKERALADKHNLDIAKLKADQLKSRSDKLMSQYLGNGGTFTDTTKEDPSGKKGKGSSVSTSVTSPKTLTISALNAALNSDKFNNDSNAPDGFSGRFRDSIVEQVRPLLGDQFDRHFTRTDGAGGTHYWRRNGDPGDINITSDMVRDWATREVDKTMNLSSDPLASLEPMKMQDLETDEKPSKWFNLF